MNVRLFLWSLVSALAGFLFGFDTVVISGAEKTIQSLWSLSPAMHGLAMGAALSGTVLGSLIGSWPTDRFGIDRPGRRTLLYIGLFGYIASLGLCAWAFHSGHFAIVPACIFAFTATLTVGLLRGDAPRDIARAAPANSPPPSARTTARCRIWTRA